MPEPTQTSAFVCPECGKAIQLPTIELLETSSVTCAHCGYLVTLDRRLPKDKNND